ncbi:hypothetical protein HAX54_014178, partial [Datura stramonium]|nr:hypothetical protein [Datura stramonium]
MRERIETTAELAQRQPKSSSISMNTGAGFAYLGCASSGIESCGTVVGQSSGGKSINWGTTRHGVWR